MLYLLKTLDYYKVGYASDDNIENRLKAYATHNPIVELLGIKSGTTKDETDYHHSFYQYEGTGEWYKVPEEIINVIRQDFTPCDLLKRPAKKGSVKEPDKNKKRDWKKYYKYEKRKYEVKQFDLNGNYIRSFNSLKEASKETGINKSCIVECSNGAQKKAGKFLWKIEK